MGDKDEKTGMRKEFRRKKVTGENREVIIFEFPLRLTAVFTDRHPRSTDIKETITAISISSL
jgi:hypothetical protein